MMEIFDYHMHLTKKCKKAYNCFKRDIFNLTDSAFIYAAHFPAKLTINL